MEKRRLVSLMSTICSSKIKKLRMEEHPNLDSINKCCSLKNAEKSPGKSDQCNEHLSDQSEPPLSKKKRKGKLKQSGPSNVEPSKVKIRPNYFVAVQVSDQAIHDKIKKIQDHMIEQDNRLEDIMENPAKLHITLMVMSIKDKETHSRALRALDRVHNFHNGTMCAEPVTLNFSGLGHFENRVVYAKIKENKSLDKLKALAESVKTLFGEENILSTDERDFNPHLTIAKKHWKWHRNIKKINPSVYKDFVEENIGNQTIKGIQLLSMTDPKDANGYYSGHELLFNLKTDDEQIFQDE